LAPSAQAAESLENETLCPLAIVSQATNLSGSFRGDSAEGHRSFRMQSSKGGREERAGVILLPRLRWQAFGRDRKAA